MKIIKKDKGKIKLLPFLGKYSPLIREKFYQKKVGPQFFGGPLIFNPEEYKGTPEEKSQKAYQHAKQYEKFYKELIKEGVYPKKTKVKAKKRRHSNKYILEMWMPEISLSFRYETAGIGTKRGGKLNDEREKIVDKITKIAKKYKCPYEKNTDHPYLDNDVDILRNYGRDEEGKMVYMDTEVLGDDLPLKERGKLEKKLLVSTIIGALMSFVFFFYPKITGNIIGNISEKPSQTIGILFLIIFIASFFLLLKKRL